MDIIGYCAGILTLVGYLPQTVKTIRSRQTKDLSLPTFVIISTSAALWVIYGFANAKLAIWVTNAVVAGCSLIVVGLKLRHG